MSRRFVIHRTSTRTLLVEIALLLVSGLLSAGPVSAHTFTKTDGNDSPSKIDLKSVSVSHTSTSVVHKVQTHNAWTPSSLQIDSFFVIGIDKNLDPSRYERCAFIYYASRLRGLLSNCGSQFIRYLPVAKSNGTTAKITIPKAQLGGAYRWYGASIWVGATPCRNVCRDFSPNTLPDILHDLTPPLISNIVIPENSETAPDSTDSLVSFQVTDKANGSGVHEWFLDRRVVGAVTWSQSATGAGAGEQDLVIAGTEGEMYQFRIRAVDRQGNRRTTPTFYSFIPFDDATGVTYDGPGGATDWTAAGEAGNFLGTYHQNTVDGATMEVSLTGSTICFYGGPSAGYVSVTIDGVPPHSSDWWSSITPRDEFWCYGLPGSGVHTVSATIESGTMKFDAYLVYP